MKKVIISSTAVLLLLTSLNGCGTRVNTNNPDNLTTVSSTSSKIRLNTQKVASNQTFTLNQPTKNLNLKQSSESKKVATAPVIIFEAPISTNSKKEHVAMVRMTLNSMHFAKTHEEGWKMALKTTDTLLSELKNDKDTGMYDLLWILRNITGTMKFTTWFNIYAMGFATIIENGYSGWRPSIKLDEIAAASRNMMLQANNWQEGCQIGESALRLYQTKTKKYRLIADMALAAPNGSLSWQEYFYIIDNALLEIQRIK